MTSAAAHHLAFMACDGAATFIALCAMTFMVYCTHCLLHGLHGFWCRRLHCPALHRCLLLHHLLGRCSLHGLALHGCHLLHGLWCSRLHGLALHGCIFFMAFGAAAFIPC